MQCFDSESGRAEVRDVDVVSDQLVALYVANPAWPPLYDNVPRRLTAFGTFAPFEPDFGPERGTRNLTQDVVYVSRDPDVAIATNDPGDRSRIVGVGPGVARIYAFDPVSGLESPDHHIQNLGRLVGLMLNHPSYNTTNRALVMPVGSQRIFTVRGIYEGGGTLKLSEFDRDSYLLESGDPTIVRILSDPARWIEGVEAGRTTVTVRHLATGLVSDPFEVTVKGSLSAIELEPSMVTRALGDEYSLRE